MKFLSKNIVNYLEISMSHYLRAAIQQKMAKETDQNTLNWSF